MTLIDQNKTLIVLYSKQYSAQLMTQEAYEALKNQMDHEDKETHQVMFIDPSMAAYMFDSCMTKEEVQQ